MNVEKTNERLEEEIQRLRAKVDRHQKERNELEDRALEAELAANILKEETLKVAGQSKKEQQDELDNALTVIYIFR